MQTFLTWDFIFILFFEWKKSKPVGYTRTLYSQTGKNTKWAETFVWCLLLILKVVYRDHLTQLLPFASDFVMKGQRLVWGQGGIMWSQGTGCGELVMKSWAPFIWLAEVALWMWTVSTWFWVWCEHFSIYMFSLESWNRLHPFQRSLRINHFMFWICLCFSFVFFHRLSVCYLIFINCIYI